MEPQLFYHVLAGLIFFGAFSLAFANPVASNSLDSMDGIQNDDDYEYSDDESVPNSHTKSTVASPTSAPFFKENRLTVSTIVGKNVTLECAAENLSDNNVILWYKDSNVLTTGKAVLNQEYALDQSKFSLIIVNATENHQGNYYCEVQPNKIRLHTTLVVSEHPIEALVPESSKSSQGSLYFSSTRSLLLTTVIGILLFLRI